VTGGATGWRLGSDGSASH